MGRIVDLDFIFSSPVIAAILTGVFALIGYSIWQKRKIVSSSKSVDIDVAAMVKNQLKLLDEIAEQMSHNRHCASEIKDLKERLESVEAEADKYEDVRRENRELREDVAALRQRVADLEDFIATLGHTPPPDTALKKKRTQGGST